MVGAARLTQRDIARLARVSQATVSLVLNEAKSPGARIPDETRARVQEAIRATGYVADPIARRMAKGLNRILGVFTYEPAFPSAQADFFAPFLLGIEEQAQELGYDLLLLTGASRPGGKRRIFDENNRLRLADGCLILGREFDKAELGRLVAGDYPFVAVGRRDDVGAPIPYVGADYAAATAALVSLARSKGHRRLAYVGPSKGPESPVDRWRGFVSVVQSTELVLHIEEVGGSPSAMLDAIRASGATAAFFMEKADAVAVEVEALARGLAVPKDFSVIVLSSHIRPAQSGTDFTTFAIPREEMARRATSMLVKRIEGGGAGDRILLPCSPVAGETLSDLSHRD